MRIGDFESQEEALNTADELILQNREDFAYEGVEIEHSNPLLQRYLYKEGHGKKKTWEQNHEKRLDGAANLSNKKKLADAKQFMEGFGPDHDKQVENDETPSLSIVSAKWEKGSEMAQDLRTATSTRAYASEDELLLSSGGSPYN